MHSRTLWTDANAVARSCLTHPFVTGIADGSLDRRAFTHYVGQDAIYLDSFARAFALGMAKAPDPPSMQTFKALLDGVMEELQLHAGYAARWGADLHPAPTPATRAYTDFLLRVAALEPAGHICAAMAPCMRLYAWLGQQLSATSDPTSPYAEWVTTYAAEEFDDMASTMEGLLDDLGGDEASIASHYATAMDLELAFFDSAHRSAQDAG
ncbi:MAG TPA: TenA family protein [Euzebya sp.]|nr:TenA family protein [Euzebya sp.]